MSVATLREFPFPYRAMLAICSDLDETPNGTSYFTVMQFLNTTSRTPLGTGLGMEVGNTIYFDMPKHQFAYWNTDSASRESVRRMIRSGHIDCLHSFGDLAITRGHAERALQELEKHNCRIECWIDHSKAPTNVGPDIMQGSGDVPDSPTYHTDLTCAYGVKFFWRGRVTSIIGQDRDRSLRGIFSPRNPVASVRTLAIEATKGAMARFGDAKYAMHAKNELIQPVTLRDGNQGLEFIRCDPYWGGISRADTADGLADVLSRPFMDRLVERRGYCVLYTHLGKCKHPTMLLNERTIAALRELSDKVHEGSILVTTTRRLLGYCASVGHLTAKLVRGVAEETVLVDTNRTTGEGVPIDLSGVTFYVNDARSARLFIDGNEVSDLHRNPADEHGRESISVPWQWLSFPG